MDKGVRGSRSEAVAPDRQGGVRGSRSEAAAPGESSWPGMRACASEPRPDTAVDLRASALAPSRVDATMRASGDRSLAERPPARWGACATLPSRRGPRARRAHHERWRTQSVAGSTEGRGGALALAVAGDAGTDGRAVRDHGRDPVVLAVLRRRRAQVDRQVHRPAGNPHAGAPSTD